MSFNTPIIFIIFNRPQQTKQVFEEIKKIKPKVLLVIADGPRKKNNEDKKKCTSARAIINDINWDCKVYKKYSNSNLGCKKNISLGLTWCFKKVDEAIILEDDVLPSPDFFKFCSLMLKKYKNNPSIGIISGSSFVQPKDNHYSYYFSAYVNVWGWATWAHVWRKYDINMKNWQKVKENNNYREIVFSEDEYKFFISSMDKIYRKKLDSWCYVLVYMLWNNKYLNIISNENLICNIGFGKDATHTKSDFTFSRMETSNMKFPLKHPEVIQRNFEYDFQDAIIRKPKNIIRRLFNFVVAQIM